MISVKISVIGSGGWGTAAALLLCRNGHSVCLWSYLDEERARLERDRENKEFLPGVPFGDADITFTSDIDFAAQYGEVLVSVVPSKAVRATAKKLSRKGNGKTVVNLSKGFDEETGCRLSEVFEQEMPDSTIAVMSLPCGGGCARHSHNKCYCLQIRGGSRKASVNIHVGHLSRVHKRRHMRS